VVPLWAAGAAAADRNRGSDREEDQHDIRRVRCGASWRDSLLGGFVVALLSNELFEMCCAFCAMQIDSSIRFVDEELKILERVMKAKGTHGGKRDFIRRKWR
jgi:hypothetical protein